MLSADLVSPALDSRSLDLDRPPAGPTDEVVVMVAGTAPSVDGLTVHGAQHVHVSVDGHGLEGAIDSREAHVLALGAKACVQVLGRVEVVDVHEEGFDGSALPGRAASGFGHQFLI
jgi:hypothetical protein